MLYFSTLSHKVVTSLLLLLLLTTSTLQQLRKTTTVKQENDTPDKPETEYRDFAGPVKKISVLLMVKEISDDLHKLFEEKTKFKEIQRELLRDEDNVKYIFPKESDIINGIGRVSLIRRETFQPHVNQSDETEKFLGTRNT